MQPLDQNHCLVPHLKDLFHICLDTIAQDFYIHFKVFLILGRPSAGRGLRFTYIAEAYTLREVLSQLVPNLDFEAKYSSRVYLEGRFVAIGAKFGP